jgi:hypothetical protein
MSERNIGNPHIGHRRFPIGGVVGLKLCGCGTARISPLIQAGAQLVSQPPTACGKTSVGDVGIWRPINRKSQSANIFKTVNAVN